MPPSCTGPSPTPPQQALPRRSTRRSRRSRSASRVSRHSSHSHRQPRSSHPGRESSMTRPTDADSSGPVDWQIRRESEALAREFAGVFSHETIERFMSESLSSLHGARTAEFVPLLAWRFTRERLVALAQAEGTMAKDRPEILFVCVHNAGRSQMAAVLADSLGAGRVHVR